MYIIYRLAIASVLFCLSCLSSVGADEIKPLPPMKNWFFAQGNWHDSAQLYVSEVGEGSRTVVALHGGWGAEHSGMRDMVYGLESDFRFVFYEQRGSLRSASPEHLITFQQHIDDLELLRRELGKNKLTLLGHSMGAVLASAYATQYPNRIEKLVLVSPAYLKNPIPKADEAIKHEAFERSKVFITQQRYRNELQKYGLDVEDNQLNDKELTAKARINFASNMLFDIGKWPELTNGKPLYKGEVYTLTSKSYPKTGWDFWQEYAKSKYPVTIIGGSHDRLDFDGLLLSHWQKQVPSVKLIIVPETGHLPWVDNQEKLVNLLNKELRHF